MRCTHCGYALDERATRCPRCNADLSRATRLRALAISVAYVLIACAVVAVLTYVVLRWHDAQMWG